MCGLVGCAGNIVRRDELIFKTLLVLDSLRGEHSTGIMAVNGAYVPTIIKTVGDPYQLFDTVAFGKIMSQKNIVLLGHNRYATSGAIVRKNAHPFENDVIIGAHNGTLHNKWELHNGRDFDVDSEALLNHIAEKGLDDALSVVKGAYAVSYYDKNEHKLSLFRNKERPLYYVINKKDQVLYWASEKWMLSVALSKHDVKDFEIVELPELHQYSFDIFNDVKQLDLKPVDHEITNLPVEEPPRANYWNETSFRQQFETNKTKTTLPPHLNILNSEYLTRKDVTLRVGLHQKNGKGAKYIQLFDENFPLYDIRYGYHKDCKLVSEDQGKYITASIFSCRKDGDRYAYMIDPNSIKRNVVLDLLGKPTKSFLEKDDKGNFYSPIAFAGKFKECGWCGDPLEYGNGNMIVGNTCFCKYCKEDEAVKEICKI